jgi:MFS family permease
MPPESLAASSRSFASVRGADVWSPAIVLAAGSLILFLSIGARQGFGLFMVPLTETLHIGREPFAFAVAIQYLVWGLAGPIGGMIADRWGAARVIATGGVLYAFGYAASATLSNPALLPWTAGMAIGLGLGGASFGVVHGAVAKAWPEDARGRALGIVGSITALGQLLLLLATFASIETVGWRSAMWLHAGAVFLIVPLSMFLSRGRLNVVASADNGAWPALRLAARDSRFWLLCVGFSASGLQVMFTMTHLPAIYADFGLSSRDAMLSLACLSLSTVGGSALFGRLSDGYSKSRLLAIIYIVRAFSALVFLILPKTPIVLHGYFLVLGLFWMSTIPVASALTAELFGVRYLGTLFSVVFLAHQVGGSLGTWMAGRVFDATGSYASMWTSVAGICAVAALLAWRIDPRGIYKDG